MMMASLELWVAGLLVTILITVLTALGSLIKAAYDISTDLKVALYGNTERDAGFIRESRNSHTKLSRDQQNIDEKLQMQGRLLKEMTYAMQDIAEQFDAEENGDASEALGRVEDLREKYDDEFTGASSDCDD